MERPTIRDLAKAAGLSVSTVNRVISGSGSVRHATMQQVLDAAERIAFYGSASIQAKVAAAKQSHRLGIILLQSNREFYQVLAKSLEEAAANFAGCTVKLRIEYLDNLSPDHVADRMLKLGNESDSLAIVAAEHPLVTEAIETLRTSGVPVTGLLSRLSTRFSEHYVGLDSWKVGRTAAWAIDNFCKSPGKLGILVGSHRYLCQEMYESGFRSYFREHNSGFSILESLATFESSAVAREVTENLLQEHPDLAGLFIAGGGVTGALGALRGRRRSKDIVTVALDRINVTKSGLLDGSLNLVIAHPLEALARATIASMIQARSAGTETGNISVILPFDILTRENF
ncbi:MAG: LacI family DNA-binding transcriptional regulator [Paracoccaceae bacterium]